MLICLCPATLRLSPSAAVPIYLTTLIRLCQELFSGIFSASNRFSRFVPSSPVQLSYSIRFLPACQVLFSSFFQGPFSAPNRPSTFQNRRPLPDSFVSITPAASNVKRFFKFFFSAADTSMIQSTGTLSLYRITGGDEDEPDSDCR